MVFFKIESHNVLVLLLIDMSATDNTTEVAAEVAAPKLARIPPLPSKSWAAVASSRPQRVHKSIEEVHTPSIDTSIVDALQDKIEELEGKLASHVVEISDLNERNKELQSQVDALQVSLEESEAKNKADIPVPVVNVVPEVAAGVTEAANGDVVIEVTADATAEAAPVPSRWWFW